MGSKLVLPETYTQFVKTLKWRREFDPRAAAMEKHDPVYDTVGYVCGKDKKGRLITYNLYGGLDNEAVRIPSQSDSHLSSRLNSRPTFSFLSPNSFVLFAFNGLFFLAVVIRYLSLFLTI